MSGRGRGAIAALGVLAGRKLGTRGAIVFAYHDVDPYRSSATEFTVSAARLRAQLKSAMRWGLRFVDLGALVHEHAFPVLGDLGLPVTAFVVGTGWGEHPEWSPGRRRMTLPELEALVAAGVRVGSHGATHRSLTGLDPAALARELADSRATLEELSAAPVDLIAYPFGHHDAVVRAATAAAGDRAGFGFANGRVTSGSEALALPRLCMVPRQRRARLAYHLARPAGSWPPDRASADINEAGPLGAVAPVAG